MKAACWNHLLPDPSRLTPLAADELEAIERTAECEAMTVTHGIAAIGELLAFTADAGELMDDTARDIGWLIKSLGMLSGRLVDVANGAEYELERRKSTAPTPTAEG
ncbi:hypothetical protein CXF92_06765 [Pseudomonas sp. Choline-3u-10]|jgi:hypothetical protein|uniref:hypothetical protein n=1 Tax=Pseudomonadaceae TaxID=135621 RepID=UPI00061836E5|nr:MULTISPECIES: hypothetical protein [Pseudomonadaceae]MAL35830.1 hypothetical protein [Pseudomonas sp.]MBU0949142.1 hypothetical protein [Gammaproteobacteria bacterium]KJJ64484.1 hypothetical protein RT21_02655 [Pseudomonas sp. 10B238]MBK3794013.1 hypothetical protein [Stutzerimonas stutzeri]MBK3875503.1 hypothetical protein [Stutzerimonas stutzeri]|tara:strand:+ start:3709 stop:4026 length:318 start_codon:yes stop_codon:yes gene_type:complete